MNKNFFFQNKKEVEKIILYPQNNKKIMLLGRKFFFNE